MAYEPSPLIRHQLIELFLQLAHETVQQWILPGADNRFYPDYYQYIHITPNDFKRVCAFFSTVEIGHAIQCILKEEWDQSEFIMCQENASTKERGWPAMLQYFQNTNRERLDVG